MRKVNKTAAEIIDKLFSIINSENASDAQKFTAVKILLKHDRDRTLAFLEDIFDNGDSVSAVNAGGLLLNIIKKEQSDIGGSGIALDDS